MDPLVHRRLPLLGPFDVEDFDEGLDGDPLKIRARYTWATSRTNASAPNTRIIGRRRAATRAADKTFDAKVYAQVCKEILGFRSIAQQSARAGRAFFATGIFVSPLINRRSAHLTAIVFFLLVIFHSDDIISFSLSGTRATFGRVSKYARVIGFADRVGPVCPKQSRGSVKEHAQRPSLRNTHVAFVFAYKTGHGSITIVHCIVMQSSSYDCIVMQSSCDHDPTWMNTVK